ncbi:MAG: atpF [Bacilli bacterium]|nr:atpF [Bacilli bacterium]
MQIEVLTFVFQILIMIILFLFLRAKAFKPIMKAMQNRSNHIEGQINDAEKLRSDAEQLVKQHQEMIDQSKKEASALLDTARRTGEQQAIAAVEAAREEVKRIKAEAVSDIAREKALALNDLRAQIGSMSVAIAEKILAREINANTHEVLLDQAVREMGEQLC